MAFSRARDASVIFSRRPRTSPPASEHSKSSAGRRSWSRYEGRANLGNTISGDGVLYHGRGIFQLTGRANYRSMGGKISVGLEDEPHLAAEGDVSLRTACEYWKPRRLDVPADSNDIREVTRRINGGFNGLADRQTYSRRAWSIWGVQGQPAGI